MPRKIAYNPNRIFPPGTQVVTRTDVHAVSENGHLQIDHNAGAVAEIITSPADYTHNYRIRFTDGTEATLRRTQFAVLKEVQREGIWPAEHALDEFDLMNSVIYRCVVGSRAYGLDHDASDVDRRGIYLPPANMHWSLYGVPEQLDSPETEECYWELQKFITLALKANPNVLECLYTPLVEHATPLAQELLEMRDGFLSRLVYQTYNGYVLSQFKKLDARLRNHGDIKWKHAMHLIRLLLAGIETLRTGTVPVDVGPHRDALLTIRDGQMPWNEINAWRQTLHQQFDTAYEETSLPERPDYERANAFLIRARQSAISTAIPPTNRMTFPEIDIDLISADRVHILRGIVQAAPYPLLFATISGAHLYGFPSPDSDFDLRGVHILPAREVMSLSKARETIELDGDRDGIELDLVTHDAAKFFSLMLKTNGYVLEQLFSPLIVQTTPEHDELKSIAHDAITRFHAHHYLGFARTQWGLFEKSHRVKPLLYTYRVLLTGIYLMQTARVEANIVTLNETFNLNYIDDLVAQKTTGPEKGTLSAPDLAFHQKEYERLIVALEAARENSELPTEPKALPALDDLLLRLRQA